MRHRLFFVITLCSLQFLATAELKAEPKIGRVDVARVIKEYGKAQTAEARMNEAKNIAKKEMEERAEAYKKAIEEIKQIATLEAPALGAEAKAEKSKERDEKIEKVRKMEVEITEFRTAREQQLQQQFVRVRDDIIGEIIEVVAKRAQASGLDLVFDTSGASYNGFSPLLFAGGSAEITSEVVRALNEAKAGGAGKTSPTPGTPARP